MKKSVKILAIAICLALMSGQVSAAPILIKWGDATPKSFSYWPATVAFKDEVEKKTNKKVEFQLFGDGVLGDQKALIESTTMGAIQMVSLSSSVLNTLAPEYQAFALPFIWPSADYLSRFLDSEGGIYLSKLLEKRGLKVIAWGYVGYLGIQNSKREVKNPEDLKGLKIRVQQNPLMVDTINAMGGMGVAMGSGELYSALQQGVIDGISTTPQMLHSMKIYEVAKFYTPVRMHSSAGTLLANLKFWESLSPDIQKACVESSKTWRKVFEDYYLDPSQETSDQNILNVYKKTGVKITEPDTEAFKRVTVPVVRKYSEKIGPEFVDKVLKFTGYSMK